MYINDVKIVIHAQVPAKVKNVNREEIARIIRNEFLDKHPDKYYRIIVEADYNEGNYPQALRTYLLYNDSTSFDSARILLGDNYSVTALEQGNEAIIEAAVHSSETGASAAELCSSSSSRSVDLTGVQLVFSTCEDDLPSAVVAVNRAYEIAVANGYNAIKLIGAEENKANVKALLNAPGIIGWGRVGYGTDMGIILDDGALYYTYFNSLQPAALENKVIFFDSCEVHNPPLLTSIVEAGVQKFIGGTRQLTIGPSEEVFKDFWDNVIADNGNITDSLNSAQLKYYYSTSAFGISGKGAEFLSDGK